MKFPPYPPAERPSVFARAYLDRIEFHIFDDVYTLEKEAPRYSTLKKGKFLELAWRHGILKTEARGIWISESYEIDAGYSYTLANYKYLIIPMADFFLNPPSTAKRIFKRRFVKASPPQILQSWERTAFGGRGTRYRQHPFFGPDFLEHQGILGYGMLSHPKLGRIRVPKHLYSESMRWKDSTVAYLVSDAYQSHDYRFLEEIAC